MSKLQVLLTSLSFCLLVTMSTSVMAELITNGDFEDEGGYLTGWTKSTGTPCVNLTTNPIGGDNTVRMLRSLTGSGNLYQDFDFTGLDITGLSDFQIDLDFAILGGTSISSGNRLFAMVTQNSAGGLVDCWDVYRNGSSYELKGFYPAATSTSYATGMYANPTTDINSDDFFNDGEVPVINHLTLVGAGYGTENYSTTVTLNGDSYTLANNFGSGNGSEITRILFLGETSNAICKDFLVDNVAVTNLSAVPEPSTMALLCLGMVSLAAMLRCRNK